MVSLSRTRPKPATERFAVAIVDRRLDGLGIQQRFGEGDKDDIPPRLIDRRA